MSTTEESRDQGRAETSPSPGSVRWLRAILAGCTTLFVANVFAIRDLYAGNSCSPLGSQVCTHRSTATTWGASIWWAFMAAICAGLLAVLVRQYFIHVAKTTRQRVISTFVAIVLVDAYCATITIAHYVPLRATHSMALPYAYWAARCYMSFQEGVLLGILSGFVALLAGALIVSVLKDARFIS